MGPLSRQDLLESRWIWKGEFASHFPVACHPPEPLALALLGSPPTSASLLLCILNHSPIKASILSGETTSLDYHTPTSTPSLNQCHKCRETSAGLCELALEIVQLYTIFALGCISAQITISLAIVPLITSTTSFSLFCCTLTVLLMEK